MRHVVAALVLACALPAYGIERSRAVRAEFMRQQPCPATQKHRGPCPNYQVDHIVPLKCGGRDAIGNLQWLTVQQHKEKTRREARMCRRK